MDVAGSTAAGPAGAGPVAVAPPRAAEYNLHNPRRPGTIFFLTV